MKLSSNFVLGRMNKSVDERLVRPGEYIDAVNVRLGSTEDTEIGSVENSKGNTLLVDAGVYNGIALQNPRTIGAYEDGTNEVLYWFVTSDDYDMIVSYNVRNSLFTHHVVSTTVLNFNKKNLITGVALVNDLLIFTDNLNPPRKININREYPTPIAGVDQITAEDLNLIVKPPTNAPAVSLFNSPGTENFLEDTFVQFAYRYKYKDGEYSAISRFSQVAFQPGPFSYDASRAGNTGMENTFNSAKVTFNTGDSNVVGIDLLFIESDKPSLNVIEKFDKTQFGYADNQEVDFVFSNGKVYTVLPESEILRLFDNVPLRAKALTLMGNRLMFGNYVEGYDLVDDNGAPINISFEADLIQQEFGFVDLDVVQNSITYTINSSVGPINGGLGVRFETAPNLVSGAILSVSFNITGVATNGASGSVNNDVNLIEFAYTLTKSYDTVYDLARSQEFIDAVVSNPLLAVTTCGTSSQGTTWTDILICTLSGTAPSGATYVASDYGITSLTQGISISTNINAPNEFTLTLPAMQFEDSGSPGSYIYQYYATSAVEGQYLEQGNPSSLHSNRDYEVGIVYMDDYGRSSTALTSVGNAVYTPPASSVTKNSIQVTIPVQQKAPSWATKYKFVLKRVQGNYETLYSQFVYTCPDCENIYYYKLEGDNQTKAAKGDILIVKADADGEVTTEVQTEILDIQAEGKNFLNDDPTDPTVTGFIPSPAGLYMQLKPYGFAGQSDDPYALVDNGRENGGNNLPLIEYPAYVSTLPSGDPSGFGVEYDLPQGSRVNFKINFNRNGRGSKCGEERYLYDKSFIASVDYDNLYEFVLGENIDFTGGTELYTDEQPSENIFYPTLGTTALNSLNAEQGKNKYQFIQDPLENNRLLLGVRSGTKRCGGIGPKNAYLNVQIIVQRADSLFIFETRPLNADLDIYYEGSKAYDIQNGFHLSGGDTSSGEQNQTASNPGVVNLEFFDCYSFGNGAEGYKIVDALDGNSFSLGARSTSVAAEDYKQAHRLASITYSGVYNNESNINKLNEFNLGLANFKDLEESFGAIQILDSRQTDVLVLQVDRISYVLAGKNLLSDAAAGGAITSIPEVLGTQITRVEEYGISQNSESFVSFGSDRYFTDAKRGAVINIKGTTYSSDSLIPISELGMRSWFRDLFVASYNTFKLGAFDPYMNEYVLSNTTTNFITTPQLVSCGSQLETLTINNGDTKLFLVDVGNSIGDMVFELNTDRTVNVLITAGTKTQNYTVNSTSGSFTFTKDIPYPEQLTVAITASNGQATINPLFNCVQNDQLTVISVCLTEPEDKDQTITNQYYWGVTGFDSPVQSELITFNEGTSQPLISSYLSRTGDESTNGIPADGSTVTIISNKLSTNDFDFQSIQNKLRYLTSDTLYSNNQLDILSLISNPNLQDVVPTEVSSGRYQGSFAYNSSNTYLYLIWDYRRRILQDLCFDATSTTTACTDCTTAATNYNITKCSDQTSNTSFVASSNITVSIGDFVIVDGEPTCVYVVSSVSNETSIDKNITALSEYTNCTQICNTYTLSSTFFEPVEVIFTDCSGDVRSFNLFSGSPETICATSIQTGSLPLNDVTITLNQCQCATPQFAQWNLSSWGYNQDTACSKICFPNAVYTYDTDNLYNVGTQIYTDSQLTTPYSSGNGSSWVQVDRFSPSNNAAATDHISRIIQIDSDGKVSAVATCPSAHWSISTSRVNSPTNACGINSFGGCSEFSGHAWTTAGDSILTIGTIAYSDVDLVNPLAPSPTVNWYALNPNQGGGIKNAIEVNSATGAIDTVQACT
jgi:hypothetical protein